MDWPITRRGLFQGPAAAGGAALAARRPTPDRSTGSAAAGLGRRQADRRPGRRRGAAGRGHRRASSASPGPRRTSSGTRSRPAALPYLLVDPRVLRRVHGRRLRPRHRPARRAVRRPRPRRDQRADRPRRGPARLVPGRRHRRRRRQRREVPAVPGPLARQRSTCSSRCCKGVFAGRGRPADPGRGPAGVPRWPVAGEPGPVAVVIPYNLLIEAARLPLPAAGRRAGCRSTRRRSQRAVALLADRRQRVGIYAGLGCMDYGDAARRGRRAAAGPGRDQRLRQGVRPGRATRSRSAGATARRPRRSPSRPSRATRCTRCGPASTASWPSA